MTSKKRRPRIAFFFQHAWIETIPFAKEPILQLAKEGYEVDVYLPVTKSFLAPNFASENVRVIQKGFARAGILAILRLAIFIFKMAITRRYDLFIANPVEALVYAAIAATLFRRPLIALSDELYTKEDSPIGSWERAWMNWAQRRATFTIITDMMRADVLTKCCDLPPDHVFFELPNCPSGLPIQMDRGEQRRGLGVKENDFLVLNAGFFGNAMGSDVFLEAIPRLPQDVFLVFQERDTVDFRTAALCQLAEKCHNVRFFMNPLPYELVDTVVAICDIGVCFYKMKGPNFELCGKGSGKICRYLRLGKPVIVNRSGGLDWIARYGAGEVAESADDLIRAIQKISANYSKYSVKAVACYHDHFSFEKYYPPIREAIQQLVNA